MSVPDDLDFEGFTALVSGVRATQYVFAVCATLWTYDFFLSISSEVALVWRSRWSLGKIVFLLSRYNPIVTIIIVNFVFDGVKDQKECFGLASSALWFYLIGTIFSDAILIMRACAIWGGNRYILYFLIISMTTVCIAECVLLSRLIHNSIEVYIPQNFIPVLGVTCLPLPRRSSLYWPQYLVCMANQTILATIALTKSFRHYRQFPTSHNTLIRSMLQDGLHYYIYTLVVMIVNLTVALLSPFQCDVYLELSIIVLNSIFGAHFILNIRMQFSNRNSITINEEETTVESSLHFQLPQQPVQTASVFSTHTVSTEFSSSWGPPAYNSISRGHASTSSYCQTDFMFDTKERHKDPVPYLAATTSPYRIWIEGGGSHRSVTE